MKKFQVIQFYLVLLFIFLTGQAFAQQSTTSTLIEKVIPNLTVSELTSKSQMFPYEKWKLPNGLTLIIHEDHSDPVVNVAVTYHVGSARESIGQSGFAHLFEHMMFEGSDNVRDKEHFKIVSDAGGTMNGFTQRDLTTYFETVPSNYLPTALWLEADRMGFLLDSVTKAKFEIQRATVKNEKAQNYENQPYGLGFGEVLSQALYPAGHPYSWPVIGYTDDLDRVTVEDLRNFFLRWYGPNNAILTVSGDVNPKDVLAMTEKFFGSIPSGPEVKKMRVPPPILAGDQYANYMDNIYLPLTLMVYPTVPSYHRDEPALDVLGDMMGDGNNSIFYKNFVKTEKAEVSIYHSTEELAGEFTIVVFAYPDLEIEGEVTSAEDYKIKMKDQVQKNFNETEKKVRETIDEFEKTGITDEALLRVKAKIESGIMEAGTSVLGKGLMLANWHLYLGKQFNLNDEIDRYAKVTKEDVTRVFNKYVKGKYAAIVNVFPKDPESKDSVKSFNPYANVKISADPQYKGLTYVKAKDNFDRKKRPASSEAKAPVVPQYYSHQLKNGLKVIGTQTSEIQKVQLLLTIDGGNLVTGSDLKKIGVARLTAAMMGEGTKNFTTEQISAELDKIGSSITFNSGRENNTIVVNCLSKNLDATLKLLEEKLLRPRFDEADFKRVKKQTIEALRTEKKSAEVTAQRLFANLIYGNTIFGSYATEKNIKKLTLDDVKNYYQQSYSPSVSKLVIVGDVSEKDVIPKLAFLEKWQAKEVKLPDFTGFAPVQQTQIYLSHKDNAAQSTFIIGHPGMAYDYNGDYYKSSIMNFSLGGNFNSRLNLNLREEKGYTYGIRSNYQGSKYPGMYAINAGVRRSATDSALREIMKDVIEFKNNGLKEEELEFTRNAYLNSEALRYESPFQKANYLNNILQYNLPKDYNKAQENLLKTISRAELNELAKKNINPDKFVILVVGNKYVIKDKLEKMGYGKVKEIELD